MENEKLALIVKEVWHDRENNFGKLFDASWDTAYYVAYKKLGNRHDAEDISQEVMIYIYHHINELKSAAAFNRWMYKIICGLCNNLLSKKARLNEVSAEHNYNQPFIMKGIDQEEFISSSENRDYILSAINKLSDKQKEVVVLYYYGEMTALQISNILGCSLEAVKNRLYQARKMLRASSNSVPPFSINIFLGRERVACMGRVPGKRNLGRRFHVRGLLLCS